MKFKNRIFIFVSIAFLWSTVNTDCFSQQQTGTLKIDNEAANQNSSTLSAPNQNSRTYQASLMHPNGKAYFFSSDTYYRYAFSGLKGSAPPAGTLAINNTSTYQYDEGVDKVAKLGGSGWKGVPTDVDGALLHAGGKAFFFKADKYYRYNFQLDQVEKTGTIGVDGWKGVPTHLDAALVSSNGKAYFFKGDSYYRFDFQLDKVDKVGKIGVDGWKGVPQNIDAAILHPNGRAYFFKGRKYYRFLFSSDKVDKVADVGKNGWYGL
ncbi:MAG: hemopexin repeat-containing protein [Pirellulaceae bacterium]